MHLHGASPCLLCGAKIAGKRRFFANLPCIDCHRVRRLESVHPAGQADREADRTATTLQED